jgi:nucleotide-binding universal stress UspA family protein
MSEQTLAEAEARIRAFQPGIPVDRQLIPAVSVTKGIVSAAADYDTIMLGAAGKGFQPKALFGNIPEIVARDTDQTVIVVKHYNRVNALVGRVLGDG